MKCKLAIGKRKVPYWKTTKLERSRIKCKLAIDKRKVPYWKTTRTSQGVSIPVSPSLGERFNPLAMWLKPHLLVKDAEMNTDSADSPRIDGAPSQTFVNVLKI